MDVKAEILKAGLRGISAKTLALRGRKVCRRWNERSLKTLEEFKYGALTRHQSIRLLKILPGEELDVVECEVFEADLEDEPSYEALSYTWAMDRWISSDQDVEPDMREPEEEKPIRCNGALLRIQINLYHALVEFRRSGRRMPIWVDQVCINQSNKEEKDDQVKKMGRIYRQAERVVVWLGKANATHDFGLRFMESLPPYPDAWSHKNKEMGVPLRVDSATKRFQAHIVRPDGSKVPVLARSKSGMASLAGEHPKWFALLRILRRGWFSRTWTLQELLLGKEVVIYIGGLNILPESLINATKWLLEFYSSDVWSPVFGLKEMVVGSLPHLVSLSEFFHGREQIKMGRLWALEKYLQVVSTRGVTQPEDKVYAGRSIIEGGENFIVDFKRSAAEVYTEFAEALVRSECGIFELSLVGHRTPTPSGLSDKLPSWVPDLETHLWPQPLKYRGGTAFHSSTSSASHQSCLVDGKALHLVACEWDKVKSVAESCRAWSDVKTFSGPPPVEPEIIPIERMGIMLLQANTLGKTYKYTGEPTIHAFWKTLISDLYDGQHPAPPSLFDSFKEWLCWSMTRRWALGTNEVMFKGTVIDSALRAVLINENESYNDEIWNDANTNVLARLDAFIALHDKPEYGLRELASAKRESWRKEAEMPPTQAIALLVKDFSRMLNRLYEPVQPFADVFENMYEGRRYFITEKGYMGVGVDSVRPGDAVMLVAGGYVPYLFRSVKGGEGTFSLIGEAYIHGIMHGETDKETEGIFETVRLM